MMSNERRLNVTRLSSSDENCEFEGEERWNGRDRRRRSEPRKSIRKQLATQSCRGTEEEEGMKEKLADELLAVVAQTEAMDCCKEDALLQRIHHRQVYRRQSNLEHFESGHGGEDSLNELKFLVSVR